MTPLLFVDRGTTVVQIDTRGAVFLRDSITRQTRQRLDDGRVPNNSGGIPVYRESGGDGMVHVVCLRSPPIFIMDTDHA